MKPRMTMNLSGNGEFELWMNEEARDLLVKKLQSLNKKNEHFHLMPAECDWGDLALSSKAYSPNDRLLEYGKVYFRTDDWDRKHFPHVLSAED